jgi:hypothetical protein
MIPPYCDHGRKAIDPRTGKPFSNFDAYNKYAANARLSEEFKTQEREKAARKKAACDKLAADAMRKRTAEAEIANRPVVKTNKPKEPKNWAREFLRQNTSMDDARRAHYEQEAKKIDAKRELDKSLAALKQTESYRILDTRVAEIWDRVQGYDNPDLKQAANDMLAAMNRGDLDGANALTSVLTEGINLHLQGARNALAAEREKLDSELSEKQKEFAPIN